jgi:excisionase family DNA binding protein
MPPRSDHQPAHLNQGIPMDKLLTVDDVAEYLGVPVNTLFQWRHKGTGPVAFRIGRHLRYDPLDVRQWLDEHAAAMSHGVS